MAKPCTDQEAPTVVDLFAGAGGLSAGFRDAGFRVVAGSDNDPDALATYGHNFPEAIPILGDIRDRQTRARLLAAAAGADVVAGGPPCQAFSQVRNHTRVIDDPRNSLYREFVSIVRELSPKAFVMENVTGMDQMRVRDQIAADLEMNGEYSVLPQVLDAVDFGVPQTRKRLIFLGVRRSLRLSPPRLVGSEASQLIALHRVVGRERPKYVVMAEQNLFATRLTNALFNPDSALVVTASDAISDLIGIPTGNRDDQLPYADLAPPQSAYQRKMRAGAGGFVRNVQVPRINRDTLLRLNGIPQGGNHRDLSDHLLDRYLTGSRWGQDNGTGRLSRKHFYAYRRLHPDIWSWTLNTKADSVYHYALSRGLSVREFARLQSFPDSFEFTTDQRKGALPGRHDGGAAHSRYRQVGNAVPPLLARAIAMQLAAVLSQAAELRVRPREKRSA